MSNASGNVNTLAVLTRQQKELRKAFQSTKSVDEMLKSLTDMEACFEESELGMECWAVARALLREDRAPEHVLYFGNRALRILIGNDDNNIRCFGKSSWRILIDVGNTGSKCTHNHKSSFFIACVCNLLGAACVDLKRYDESLSHLNWANRNLSKLEEEDPCSGNCVLHTLHCTQLKLFKVKVAMGREQETVVHVRKILEIKEKTMEEGSIGLGEAYKDVSDAYLAVTNFEKSLPFALKALEIYTKHVGDDSAELAQVRRNLGTIYGVLEEYEKALELTRLSLSGLKSMDCSSHWLTAQMGVANMLIALGRTEEGIDAFKSLLPLAETEGNQQVRACSFTCMARGFCNLGKFSDAKKYMKIATRILEKKQISPMVVATAFEDMSRVYEEMEEYESAISYLRRGLAIPELPQKNLIASSSRLFLLIFLTKKEKKGISYLEEVVERLKEKFGPEHCQVGHGYIYLGVFYMHLGKREIAAKCFLRAKDIMDVSLGPYHLDSLRTSQTLSMNYAEMESYDLAIGIQEKVVEGLKVLGPSEQEKLDVAISLLKEMKEVATCEDSEYFPTTNSKCGVSEDGEAVFSIAETEGNQEARAVSVMCIARVFCNQDKFSDAKKYMKIAQRIFDKKDINPLVCAIAFEDMSKVYEEMEDYEAAISYLQRALNIPELPQNHLIDSCSRLFSLISLTGKEKKGIPYLEEVVERLKEKFGPDHCQVGYGYTNLGIAYMNSGQTESAVKFMAYAKDIMDVSLGPNHLDSLQTSQTLSINYADMGRYHQAIEIQEKVVEGLKGLGQSEQEFQDEAVRLLNQMKEMAIDEVVESPQPKEHA